MIIKSLFVGPAKLYGILLAFLGGLYLISPIKYKVDYTNGAVLIVVALQLSIIIGFFLSQRLYSNMRFSYSSHIIGSELQRVVLPILFLVGCIGFALKLYTMFFIKGVPLTINPIEIRLALLNDIGAGRGGGASIIAAVLYPFCLLFIPLYMQVERHDLKVKFMFFVILMILLVDALLTGGGTSLIITFLYLIFSLKGRRLSLRAFSGILFALVVLLSIASVMWLARLETMFGGVTPYLNHFSASWIAHYDQEFISVYNDESFFDKFLYIVSWLSYYFVHGYFEFIHLLVNFDFDNVTYGMNQAYLALKLLAAFGIDMPSKEFLLSGNIIQGHYQTFWGLAFIDFGYLFLIESFFLAWLSGYLYYSKRAGLFSGVIFYPYIQTQIIYSFLSNSLSGQVSYLIFSGVILLFFLKTLKWWKLREKSYSIK